MPRPIVHHFFRSLFSNRVVGVRLLSILLAISLAGLITELTNRSSQSQGDRTRPIPVRENAISVASDNWRAGRPIRLRHTEITPLAGISPELRAAAEKTKAEGRNVIHAIVQRANVPRVERWRTWNQQGIHYGAYLGEGAWILRIDLGSASIAQRLDDVRREFEAQTLTLFRPEYKADPRLLAGQVSKRALDAVTGRIEVIVIAYADTARATLEALLRANSATDLREIGPSAWTAKVPRAALRRLIDSDDIQFIEEGPFIGEPLMEFTRVNTGAESVQQINAGVFPPTFFGWTGKNVRVSNAEGLDPNHDDFWNHNAAGARTTARWIACSAGNGAHGTMTAGIMMGNGWNSMSNGGARRYQYRGMAPEAIFDCDFSSPDVANWSFTQGFGAYTGSSAATDAKVRSGFANVGAVANQGIHPQYGIEAGYYSAYRVNKNEIIVGNFDHADFSWRHSSLGPTWDGRLRPDIAAPGSSTMFPRLRTADIPLEIDWVQLISSSPQTWNFNSGANWQGGWGVDGWWGRQNLNTIVQFTDGTVTGLRAPILPPPYGPAWQNRPLLGTLTLPNGTTPLSLNGASGDLVRIRYRLPAMPEWADAGAELTWSTNHTSYVFWGKALRFIADGQWHTAVVKVGTDSHWVGLNGIDELIINVYGPSMWVPYYGNTGYLGAGGSSAASPVVAGAVALLHDQIVTRFGAVLGNRSAKSPFFYGTPANGIPLPSTFKAILIHTARDLASVPAPGDPNNPDTGAPTVYHKGPDLASGYGMLDVAEATRLVESQLTTQRIIEREFTTSNPDTYTIVVPAGTSLPLKVTLAWDDAPGAASGSTTVPKLVNNLDLKLTSPSAVTHYPWSHDPPYVPTSGQEPGNVEPEPLTAAAIHPARQNQPNNLDNVEQVYVEFPEAGTWQVTVSPTGLAAPPQKYSLIVGTPSKPATMLTGGKVVFCSTRTNPEQLFVQNVGATTPPTQVTSGVFPARHPAWSPNGQYIAYITSDIVVGNSSNQVDVLMIVTATGVVKGVYHGPSVFGRQYLGYPEWSADGKKIFVTVFDNWGDRGLSVLQFAPAYAWGSATTSVLMPLGLGPSDVDPADAAVSGDGRTVYFGGDNNAFSGGLFMIPAGGGSPIRLWGDAEPIRRGYHPSLAPNGKQIIFNSEMWKEGSPAYLDEEIVELDLMTGVLRQWTKEPGNQYAWFAINGQGGEVVMQSNTSVGGENDIFLQQNGVRIPLYIADPGNAHNDHDPKWWKAVPPPSNDPVELKTDDKISLNRRRVRTRAKARSL